MTPQRYRPRAAGRAKLVALWLRIARALAPACVGVVAASLALPAEIAFAQGPSAAYAKAAKAYKDGKLKLAYKILIGIVRKYPDHQPSYLLLGRIMFRNGRVAKAAKFFKKVPADLVSGDAAYEYGIAMFTAKDCKRAIEGLGRVPSSSKLVSYAAFYRGICHYRLRQYEKANVFLGRAKKLPAELEATRREALAATRKALRSERRGGSPSASPIVITPTPPPPAYMDPTLAAPPPAAPEGAPPEPKKPAPPPPPQSGFTNAITPSLTVTRASTTADYHGFSVDEGETDSTELKLGLKLKYQAAPRPSGGQPYLSLGLDLGQTQSANKGSKVKFIAYENDPGTIVEQESETGTGSATSASMTVNPEGGYPITGAITASAGYKLSETYPDMKADKKTATRGPYGALDLGFDFASLKLSGNQTESVADTGQVTKTSTTVGGEVSKNWETASLEVAVQQTSLALTVKPAPGAVAEADMTTQVGTGSVSKTWEAVTLTASLSYTAYAFNDQKSYVKLKEDESLKSEIGLNKTFEFGGSVSASAALTKLTGYKVLLEDKVTEQADADGKYPSKLFKAEGTAQTLFAQFKLAPLDWLFGTVSYKYTTQAWAIGEAARFPPAAAGSTPAPPSADPQAGAKLEGLFQQNVPEVLTEFKIQVGVSKSF